jgi:DNA polymerase I
MSEKKLFLLDAYALIFRAYYAFIKNPRITSYGLNTSAIFGFTNTLLDIINNQKPTHLAVVFDHHSPTLREQEHSFYKANRDETPEDIKLSDPLIKKLIAAFNIPILESKGYEADDVIGTLTVKAEEAGFTTYMMTSDKDYGQLVTDKTFMYRPGRGGSPAEIWNPEVVCEKFGLDDPIQVIDFLGLMGDAVDNIPGVPGVGPKTASKLIKEYGSMEKLYEDLSGLKGKLLENLDNNREQAFVSKKLATILLDAPVDFVEADMVLETPNKDAIRELFAELEFRNLANKVLGETPQVQSGGQLGLFGNTAPQASAAAETNVVDTTSPLQRIEDVKHQYELVDTAEKRRMLLLELKKQKEFCFDTETTSLNPRDAELLGCAFSFEKHKGYYVTFPKGKDEVQKILEEFRPIFEGKYQKKILQNAKYDLLILKNYGVDIKGPVFDTMLAHYLIEPDQRHNMDALSAKYLNYQPISITELIGKKGKNQLTFDTVEIEKAVEYAVEDADITFQLYKKLDPLLDQHKVRSVFDEIETPLFPVLARMEAEGVNVDAPFLNKYSEELEIEVVQVEKEIYDNAGLKFNIASPKQLGEVLFNILKLDDKAKKTKSGQYKTDEETLNKLADKHELPKMILDFRQIKKLKSTYVDAIPKLIHPSTGRVHTSFGQAVAATGRLSSNNPNLQNIPIRTEKGRHIRKAFVPRDSEHILLAADYSQIELRIIASISEDKGMIDAFNGGLDIHKATAAKVFDVPLEEVTSEMRSRAKTVNFGIIYGISAFGLSQRIGISRTDAKEIIDSYFQQFPGIKKYMASTIDFCRDNGYVQTLAGRRRYIRDINSQNRTVVGFAERNAINAPIQGTAADMIKYAMINVDEEMVKREMKSKMILQVHDELLFDVHKSELEEVQSMAKSLMEGAMQLKVPIVVDSGLGQNWLEAH